MPSLYSEAGFRAVARLPFNDEYAPPGWNYDTFKKFNGGRPDVVFMVHDPEHAKPYKAGDGKTVASYDDGLAAQAEALKELNKRKDGWDGLTSRQQETILAVWADDHRDEVLNQLVEYNEYREYGDVHRHLDDAFFSLSDRDKYRYAVEQRLVRNPKG